MAASVFLPGQRWISDGEPDLGLGTVRRVGPRTVTLSFPATGETREYGLDQPPLRRVRFRPGDPVRDRDDRPMVVRAVTERDGRLVYRGPDRELAEADLSARLSFSDPLQRLLAGEVQPAADYQLRLAALGHQHRQRQSPVRGFLGGRVERIPHQLYVAAQVAGRLLPRTLLADEVGLGKTIEAGLILHRLLVTGRARRVLVLLPDSLLHQWFLELYRRFNLWFHIFDEARCAALEAESPGGNPFLEDQLLLCPLSLLTGSPERADQALAAGWDLVVVDEAQHLAWSPEAASPGYALVQRLGAAAPGLLLLTATPGQLGPASHFGRLRLLDPDRFQDLDRFTREAAQYRAVANLADAVRAPGPMAPWALEALAALLHQDPAELRARLDGPDPRSAAAAREACLEALLDRHGTSRVLFRNTRAAVTGFPRRLARPAPLAATPAALRQLAREWAADLDPAAPFRPDYGHDPRLDWLAELLRDPDGDKVLLICRTRAKAEAIAEALRPRVRARATLFHEGLTLVQRDRNAAWFAEPGGARILLCSEIGSEGRNFQFAHQLVLFDLPLDPDLLEQRLGRLDRIGQTRDIQVHVPYLQGSAQEVLARWYHEGLDAFSQPLQGGQELLARWYHEGLDAFSQPLQGGQELLARFRDRLAGAAPDPAVEPLLDATRAAREVLRLRLEQGRDRLLELSSCRPGPAAALVEAIAAQDADPALERFMLGVFEHFFVEVQDLAERTYQLGAMGVLAQTFPGLPGEGLTVTFDRRRALAREELQFLTWDHPLVVGALDLLLGEARGTTCRSRWPDAQVSACYLEVVFVLECLAPPGLQADRFLPPTPLRVLVDHQGRDLTRSLPRSALARQLEPDPGRPDPEADQALQDLVPRMLRQAEAAAAQRSAQRVARAREEMAACLGQEQARLLALQRLNGAVGVSELRLLQEQQATLDQHLQAGRPRLDALHLIRRGR